MLAYLHMDNVKPFVSRDVYEHYGQTHSSGLTAIAIGACEHNGCSSIGYDLTEHLCSVHFVTDVLASLEDLLHEANFHWLAACEAESNAKTIWRCACGMVGTYAERDKHFMANNGSPEHQPALVPSVASRVVGRTRITIAQNPNKIEEIG